MDAKRIATTAVVALVVVVAYDRFKDQRPVGAVAGIRRAA